MAIAPRSRWKVVEDLWYDAHHQWARQDDVLWTLGISDYTQDTAGDILYIALPEPGTVLEKGQPFGSLESGKWVGQLYAPFDGVVIAANEQVRERPGMLNHDPYGRGWIVKVKAQGPDPRSDLLSGEEYRRRLEDLEER